MDIRIYRTGDEVAAAALAARTFEAFVASDYSEEGRREFAQYIYPGAIAGRQSEDCVMLIAWDGELAAGLIECRKMEHISLLFVAPERQRQGIGRRLLERLLNLIARLNPGLESLTVYSSPGAVPVYGRYGFAPIGVEQCVNGIRFTPMRLALPLRSPLSPEHRTDGPAPGRLRTPDGTAPLRR